jgi:hypothetical protein
MAAAMFRFTSQRTYRGHSTKEKATKVEGAAV